MRTVLRSFAKVNLHLQVVGRRSDGYHELRTVFQTISLHDEIELELTSDGTVALAVEGADLPTDERNLAHRAARRYLDRWADGAGVRIVLRKRVPAGGGLGGGSANAATVLLGLDELLGSRAGDAGLWTLARGLGADVPFFLVGGTAVGFGRGEEVLPVAELAPTTLWLAVPPVAVPTPAVFGALAPPEPAPLALDLLAPLMRGAALDLAALRAGGNDLEAVVFERWPAVGAVRAALCGTGAEIVRLSGSGATVIAIFRDQPAAAWLAARLPAGCRLERAETLSRVEIERRRRVVAP